MRKSHWLLVYLCLAIPYWNNESPGLINLLTKANIAFIVFFSLTSSPLTFSRSYQKIEMTVPVIKTSKGQPNSSAHLVSLHPSLHGFAPHWSHRAQVSKWHLHCLSQWFIMGSVRGLGRGSWAWPSAKIAALRWSQTRREAAAHKAARGKTSQLLQDPASLRTETQVLIIIFLHDQCSERCRNQYISIHATFSYLSEVTAGESLCQ